MTLSAALLHTSYRAHVVDLWPQGEPAATPEWIRAHAFDIPAALERMFAIDQHGRASSLRRIPHRLHWLLAELDQTTPLDARASTLASCQQQP